MPFSDYVDSTTSAASLPTTTTTGGKVAQDVNVAGGTVTIDESTLATSAKQDVNHTDLAAILAASPLGQALAAAARPVVLTAIQIAQIAQDATLTGRFPTGTVPADAEANSGAIATMSRILSRLQGYNGATWDMLRTAVTTPSTTLTGFLNGLPWAIYNASPTTRTEGQGGPLQADTKGNLNSNLGTLLAGEDQLGTGASVTGVMAVAGQYSYFNITGTGNSAAIKSGAGLLQSLVFNNPVATSVITVYDSLTASGTVIGTITIPASPQPFTHKFDGVKVATGLSVKVATAACDITVVYR